MPQPVTMMLAGTSLITQYACLAIEVRMSCGISATTNTAVVTGRVIRTQDNPTVKGLCPDCSPHTRKRANALLGFDEQN